MDTILTRQEFEAKMAHGDSRDISPLVGYTLVMSKFPRLACLGPATIDENCVLSCLEAMRFHAEAEEDDQCDMESVVTDFAAAMGVSAETLYGLVMARWRVLHPEK